MLELRINDFPYKNNFYKAIKYLKNEINRSKIYIFKIIDKFQRLRCLIPNENLIP